MTKHDSVTSVVIAGIGGQGVITVSDILAAAVFNHGFDIKKSEIHGMSQRGGSVTSDIRFGEKVFSPTVPAGKADFLLLVNQDQMEKNRHLLKPNGIIISPTLIELERLPNPRSLNLALLGLLSGYLEAIDEENWRQAIREVMPAKLHMTALPAFEVGRAAFRKNGK